MNKNANTPHIASALFVFLDAIDPMRRGTKELDPGWVVQSLNRLGLSARISEDGKSDLVVDQIILPSHRDTNRTPPHFIHILELASTLYTHCFNERHLPALSAMSSYRASMSHLMQAFETKLEELGLPHSQRHDLHSQRRRRTSEPVASCSSATPHRTNRSPLTHNNLHT